jgi:dienelactone hydrolase
LFSEPHAEPPATREPNTGIRCMALEGGGPIPERLAAPIGGPQSGPRTFKPVSDDVFATFLSMGTYSAAPLASTVDDRDESPEHWIVETVSFAAAYDDQRVPAYLLLPKNASPPFQAVIYAPPGSAFAQPSRDDLRQATDLWMRHVLRSGRAMLYPVLKGTYDRRPAAPDPDQGRKQINDIRRSLEYLESRPDIDAQRIGYVGFSFGGALGRFLAGPGFERLEALILVASGIPLGTPPPPHRDGVNFAPRVRTPVLMINGRYDSTYPVETSIEPLFRLFGAPEADKKLLLYDSGHVPQPALLWIKEALDWLDRYLGPVDGAASPPVDP